MIRNILFDLDGTLTDSAGGITDSLRHAVVSLGRRCPPGPDLAPHIGTPLREIFHVLLETTDPGTIESAVELYRDRYAEVGLRENRVYDGIAETLRALHGSGQRLFVATAKGQRDAERVVGHFGLDSYFEGVFGVTTDAERADKSELVLRLVRERELEPAATAMVGDRSHDMHCARRAGLRGVGAGWGYGTSQELLDAGASAVAGHPAALPDHLSLP